ncbi:MAG: toll/interleukin-1 receptor domain-containing protein [Anaerolineae bacterium]|nr:MAG: toll/interleukin-1 receptor domain-containing protein [Anaerolineae bacterium]
MTDAPVSTSLARIMISYSRKDKEFVRQVYDGLLKLGLPAENVWVDWEGIPLSADWMAEITKGIQSADVIVFIISPDSVSSKVCAEELELALANNKKLVPILHREPNKGDKLDPKIAATNWVYMRPQDNFEATLPALFETINTDLEWVAEHTRLLSKGIEWQQRDQNPSYLLRGVDLLAGETFITTAASGKDPLPTELQANYISASRTDDLRRRRRNQSIAVVVSIVLAGLALFAYLQRNSALESERVATYNFLASEARQLVGARFDLAGLLALESLRVATTSAAPGYAPTREDYGRAISTVGQVAAASPTLYRQLASPHTSSLSGLVFAPDGSFAISSDNEGVIARWNGETFQLEWEQTVASVRGLAIHPDSGTLLISDNGILKLMDASTGEVLLESAGGPFYENPVFSPDGSRIATNDAGLITVLDSSNLEIRTTIQTWPDEPAQFFTFSPDGRRIVAASLHLGAWDAATGELLTEILEAHIDETDTVHHITALTFIPGERVLATVDFAGYLRLRDPNTLENNRGTYTLNNLVTSLSSPLEGSLVAAASKDYRLILVDTATGETDYRSGGHARFLERVAYSPDGRFILSASEDGHISAWLADPTSPAATDALVRLAGSTPELVYAAFHPASGKAAVGTIDGEIFLVDLATGELIRPSLGRIDYLGDLAFSPDGAWLVAGFNANEAAIRIWDVASRREVEVRDSRGGAYAISFSSDGSQLFFGAFGTRDNPLSSWSFGGGNPTSINLPLADYTESSAMSPSGDWLAISQFSYLGILETDTVACCRWETTDLSGRVATAMVFTPGEEALITGMDNGLVLLWDLTAEQFLPIELFEHLDSVRGLAISPDGRRLVSISDDGSLALIDLEDALMHRSEPDFSAVVLSDLVVDGSGFLEVAFGPDGVNAYTFDILGNLRIWNLDPDTWSQLLCSRVGRNLTQDEWARYLGDDYRPTCPED